MMTNDVIKRVYDMYVEERLTEDQTEEILGDDFANIKHVHDEPITTEAEKAVEREHKHPDECEYIGYTHVYQDDETDQWVSYTPWYYVSSCGDSKEEAVKNCQESLYSYLNSYDDLSEPEFHGLMEMLDSIR